MSSQRYSLSGELTHIVCSKRYLLALLSVVAGTACPLYHHHKAHVNTMQPGSGWEQQGILDASWEDQGWLCNYRRRLGIPGVHHSQIF